MQRLLAGLGIEVVQHHPFARGVAAGGVAVLSFLGGATSDALGGSPVTTWAVVSAIATGAATMFYKLLQRNDDRVDQRIQSDTSHIKSLHKELDAWRDRAVRAEIEKAKLQERLRLLEENE